MLSMLKDKIVANVASLYSSRRVVITFRSPGPLPHVVGEKGMKEAYKDQIGSTRFI